MKAVGAAFVAGMLGVLLGSLAAQGPDGSFDRPTGAGLIHEGPLELATFGTDPRSPNVLEGGVARVYPGWVALPGERGSMRFIPSDQIVTLTFRGEADRNRGDFDAPPGADGRPRNYDDPNAGDLDFGRPADGGRPRNTGVVPPGFEPIRRRGEGQPADEFTPPRADAPPAKTRPDTFREN